MLRTEVQRPSVVALRRSVLRRLVRIAALVEPRLKILGRLGRDSQSLCHERGVLQCIALGYALVLEPPQMECLVRERVRGPAGVELLEATVAPIDAREVDGIEVAECLARLRREIRVVRRTPGLVELDPSRFASCVDKARDKARATHRDRPPGEVARDRGQLVLLADALLVTREAERREAAHDEEEYSNDPH